MIHAGVCTCKIFAIVTAMNLLISHSNYNFILLEPLLHMHVYSCAAFAYPLHGNFSPSPQLGAIGFSY